MTCAEVRGLLGDVADARIAPEALAEWNAHLASCDECRLEWASFRRTLDRLHELPGERAPADFVERVMAAAYPESWLRRLARRLFVPVRLKLPLEGAALVLATLGAVYLVQHTPAVKTVSQGDAARRPALTAPATLPPDPVASLSREVPFRAEGDRSLLLRRDESRADQKTAPRTGQEQIATTLEPPRAAGEAAEFLEGAHKARRAAPVTSEPAVVGRLLVENRDAAERALGALNARVGAAEVGRALAEDGVVVELDVPRARYAEFSRGLAELGRWTPGEERVESDSSMRFRITVVRSPAH